MYNVHLLRHLADDAEIHRPPDNAGYLKTLVESPNNPPQQIHRRLREIEMTHYEISDCIFPQNSSEYSFSPFSGPVIPNFARKQYKKLRYKDFQFSTFSQIHIVFVL